MHLLSWDLAGIMDKIQFGDYLAKVPRVSNMIYTVVLLVPFVVPWVRRSLFPTRRHRQLLGVILLNVGVRGLGDGRLRRARLAPDVPPVAGGDHPRPPTRPSRCSAT